MLFVLDPLSTVHPQKDSSYLMIAEAQRQGYQPWAVELGGLLLRGADAYAFATPISVPRLGQPVVVRGPTEVRELGSFRPPGRSPAPGSELAPGRAGVVAVREI